MAFSTQKELFEIPFADHPPEDPLCKTLCIRLKRYESATDIRSWSYDKNKQSKFLYDLCTKADSEECNKDLSDEYSKPLGYLTREVPIGLSNRGRVFDRPYNELKDGNKEKFGADGKKLGTDGKSPYIKVGDSLIDIANTQLGKIAHVLHENKLLKKELQISNDKLKTAKLDKENIKKELVQRIDDRFLTDFNAKLKDLSSGKIDQKELMQLKAKIEQMYSAYQTLRGENSYLQVLVEKLSLRSSMDKIQIEPEKSSDVNYLRNEINKLRKELMVLRKNEDKQMTASHGRPNYSEEDVETIKNIIGERNNLREKLKAFRELELKLSDLQKKSKETDQMSDDISSSLNDQTKCIGDMEKKMDAMQQLLNESELRNRCMQCELIQARCEAEQAQVKINSIQNELLRYKTDIGIYEYQQSELLYRTKQFQNNGYSISNSNEIVRSCCNRQAIN